MAKLELWICDKCGKEDRTSNKVGGIPPAGWYTLYRYGDGASGTYCSVSCVINTLSNK